MVLYIMVYMVYIHGIYSNVFYDILMLMVGMYWTIPALEESGHWMENADYVCYYFLSNAVWQLFT
jgi:hypothetical protein